MSTSNLNPGKSLSLTAFQQPSTGSNGGTTANFESPRRPSQSISFHPTSAPKKGQGSRKQHRDQRRPQSSRTSKYIDQDQMAEFQAVRNPSSRRGQTSITHLLDYTAPRPYRDHSSYGRNYRKNPTWGPGSGYHAVDKARFVHANYRFVVSPGGNYVDHVLDADHFLDWSCVLQIIASSQSQATSCPICLSEPVAPRMAKCGHLFCLPCLLRFMSSLSDEEHKSGKGARWKRCPICEDTIYLHDVRPLRFYAGQESPLPRPGEDVVLRLMARNANSTLALPRGGVQDIIAAGAGVPWHFAANVLDYARIMKGTSDYMTAQFDGEITALMHQEKEDELLFNQGNEWTQKAVRTINSAKEKMCNLEGVQDTVTSSPSAPQTSRYADYYFFAAPPHLYLSPLDIRILKSKYGAFSSFPSTLLPTVEHIRSQVLDADVRKRHKYLGHLPLGCVISFLECDWTDIVPAEILDSFKAELQKRRRDHSDKEAQEERERQDAERIETAALRASTGSRRLAPSEEAAVPSMDLSEFVPLSVNAGTTPPPPRSGFDSLADVSTSPSNQTTIWGTRAVQASPELEPVSNPVDDGWLRDDDIFDSTALTMELEAIDSTDNRATTSFGSMGGDASPLVSGGGRKKKKQKITLMSTGGRRGI